MSLKEDTNKNKVHYKMEKTGAKIREIKMEKGTKGVKCENPRIKQN